MLLIFSLNSGISQVFESALLRGGFPTIVSLLRCFDRESQPREMLALRAESAQHCTCSMGTRLDQPDLSGL